MEHQLDRVWFIEDDLDEQELVRIALGRANSNVILEPFRDPGEAIRRLESIESGFPRLIVSDLKLPKMTGIEFLDWLRTSPFCAIPVIIRSNSALQEDVNTAYEHGANCYIQKGFDLATVQKNFKLLLQFWSHMCTPEVRQRTTS
jgi:CheY-like chemotaxis protein